MQNYLLTFSRFYGILITDQKREVMKMLKRYSVFLKVVGGTRYLGNHFGKTFAEACRNACLENFGSRETAANYNPYNNTYWSYKFSTKEN